MNDLPRIYVINLDRDSERLAAMTAQLDALGLTFERFPAIRGTDLPTWLLPYFQDANGSIFPELSAGEIGCYASHLQIMLHVAEGNAPALVFEDDLHIAPDFPALLGAIMATDTSWDIIRLSHGSRRKRQRGPWSPVCTLASRYTLVRCLRAPSGTGAYLISPGGARKFLQFSQPRWRPVDQDLRRLWEHRLTTLSIVPAPIDQNIGKSTIDELGKRAQSREGKRRDNRWADRLREAIYNYRAIGPWPAFKSYMRDFVRI